MEIKNNWTPEKRRLRRQCKACGEMFVPDGKFCKLCKKCYSEALKEKDKWRSKTKT